MKEQQRVQESLLELLAELQKVKDLNNMANQYKEVAANLLLAMQKYVSDSKDFANAFNDYLQQTNSSVSETRNAMTEAVDKLQVADGTIEKKICQLSAIINKMNLQCEDIDKQYQQCQELEKVFSAHYEKLDNRLTEVIEALQMNSHSSERAIKAFSDEMAIQNERSTKHLSALVEEQCAQQTHDVIVTLNEQEQKFSYILSELKSQNDKLIRESCALREEQAKVNRKMTDQYYDERKILQMICQKEDTISNDFGRIGNKLCRRVGMTRVLVVICLLLTILTLLYYVLMNKGII